MTNPITEGSQGGRATITEAAELLTAGHRNLLAARLALRNAKEAQENYLARERTINPLYTECLQEPDPKTGKTNEQWREDLSRRWFLADEYYQAIVQRVEKAESIETDAQVQHDRRYRLYQIARMECEFEIASERTRT